jgi:hypothetical protein
MKCAQLAAAQERGQAHLVLQDGTVQLPPSIARVLGAQALRSAATGVHHLQA